MDEISLTQVSFAHQHASQPSLKHVDLNIRTGECILLTGKSGCGKTTITRLINGLIPHFYPGHLSGEVLIRELNVSDTPAYLLAQTVGSVFQDPRSQFFTTNTTAEVAFGLENLGLDTAEIQTRTQNAFAYFQIEYLTGRSIFSLSSGEKQKIALAAIYAMHPDIYVLDEPSANLDIVSTLALKELLRKEKAAGKTILIAEHRLYYLMDLVDRIYYMEEGRITAVWSPDEALMLAARDLTGRGLRVFQLAAAGQSPGTSATTSRYWLECRNLSYTTGGARLLNDIDITVAAGAANLIGIVGPNGVGKTTLAKCLCGLLPKASGQILIDNKQLSWRECSRNMYFVMQDPDYQLFTEQVQDELELSCPAGVDNAVQIPEILKQLELEQYSTAHPMALSGGQKQRVTIASAVLSQAKVLLFDEPTSGLDGASMERVGEILRTLGKAGRIILVISHDYEFLVRNCQRILCMDEGQVTDDFAMNSDGCRKLLNVLVH